MKIIAEMSEIITRIRRTNNLIVEDIIKYRNGKAYFGTTKIIKKVLPLKTKIKNKIINSKIVRNIQKAYQKLMNLKSSYHLLRGQRLELKYQKHYEKHISLKHKFGFFNLHKFDVNLYKIRVNK